MIYSQISQVPDFIQAQIAALGLGRAISAIAVKPSHRGGVAEVPGWLHPALAGALQSQGYESLYQHQVEAITAAIEGKDVVITTPTASGKSLAFQLPMLQAVAADRRSGQAFRSLYLAPTKALIVDQQDKLKGWMMNLSQAGEEVRAVTLTGDTTGDRALLFKPAPDVLLSNPDCINNLLHKQVYPQFAGLKLFLKQLRYVVLDEVQSYTGIFGCNVANLMRRIRLAVVRAGGTASAVHPGLCNDWQPPAALADSLWSRAGTSVCADQSEYGSLLRPHRGLHKWSRVREGWGLSAGQCSDWARQDDHPVR